MKMNTTPIEMEWFHNLEGDRTKLNWFLLELAMEYYEIIRKSPVLEAYRNQYSEQQIAQYCAYYARRMRKSMLNGFRGRTRNYIFYEEYVTDFYPHHDGQLNGTLNGLAMEAFETLRTGCGPCPQQCLNDYRSRSILFDEYMD